MTEKLYDASPYGRAFTSRVVSCTREEKDLLLVLEGTLFFPEEGGQFADRGTIEGLPVLDVSIDGDVITHRIQAPEGADPEVLFPEGAEVSGEIDWDERFSRMQNHSGEHILSGILHSRWGYENVGFRLGEFFVTIDTGGALTWEDAALLEQLANEVVYADVPVTASYPDPALLSGMTYRSKKEIDGPVRIVEIEGVDCCACCAPHVRRTGEIGLIRILDLEKTGDATRLTVLCGRRALDYTRRCGEALRKIGARVSKPAPEAYEGVEALFAKLSEAHEDAGVLQGALVEAGAALALAKGSAFPVIFERPLPGTTDRMLLNRLLEGRTGFAAVFSGDDASGYRYLVGAREADAREIGNLLRQNLGARGGGKPDMVQGFVQASREEILAVLPL